MSLLVKLTKNPRRATAVALAVLGVSLSAAPASADADTVQLPLQTASGIRTGFPVDVSYTTPDGQQVSAAARVDYRGGFAEFDAPAGSTVVATTKRNEIPPGHGFCPDGFTQATTTISFSVGDVPPTLVAPPIASVLTNPALSDYERRAFDQLNRLRAEAGSAPVVISDRLNMVADMGATANHIDDGCGGHLGRNGEGTYDRMVEAGARGLVLGEVLGSTCLCDSSPEEEAQSFLASPGHRRTVLDPRFTQVGVSFVGHYLVMVFADDSLELFADAPSIPLRGRTPRPEDDAGSGPAGSVKRPAKVRILGAAISASKRGVTIRGRITPGQPGQAIKVAIAQNGKRVTTTTRTRAHGMFTTRRVKRVGSGRVVARVTVGGASRTVRSR